jgi:hypothetical protein
MKISKLLAVCLIGILMAVGMAMMGCYYDENKCVHKYHCYTTTNEFGTVVDDSIGCERPGCAAKMKYHPPDTTTRCDC